jgi:hypothetical protein
MCGVVWCNVLFCREDGEKGSYGKVNSFLIAGFIYFISGRHLARKQMLNIFESTYKSKTIKTELNNRPTKYYLKIYFLIILKIVFLSPERISIK